jgi:hypothetical protein
VLEARTELDLLEEIFASPLILADPEQWGPFLAAAPKLLAPSTSCDVFCRSVLALLFPDAPYLGMG